jgi:hypothetical protein
VDLCTTATRRQATVSSAGAVPRPGGRASSHLRSPAARSRVLPPIRVPRSRVRATPRTTAESLVRERLRPQGFSARRVNKSRPLEAPGLPREKEGPCQKRNADHRELVALGGNRRRRVPGSVRRGLNCSGRDTGQNRWRGFAPDRDGGLDERTARARGARGAGARGRSFVAVTARHRLATSLTSGASA